jgi:hypothetical protein
LPSYTGLTDRPDVGAVVVGVVESAGEAYGREAAVPGRRVRTACDYSVRPLALSESSGHSFFAK